MKDQELTQDIVNEFYKSVEADWKERVKESGKTELMYKMSSEGIHYLWAFKKAKDYHEELGYIVPDIFKGTTINLS